MSDYLRRRFPLDDTSTVYMSGKAVYNLVRHDRPGIIASVELLPGDAERFREAVKNALADAWDQGHEASERDWNFTYDLSTPDQERQPWTNPYREE